MTVRLAAIFVALAVLVAGAAAPASGATVQRSSSSAAKNKACTKKPSQRARAACRRARASAGFRRGAAGGRALLAPRAARPTAAVPGRAATGPAVPGAPAPPAGDPPAQSPTDPVPVASTIGAEAYDFGSFVLRLTKASVPAGQLTIYFRNHDVSDHNLWIDPPTGAGTPTQISAAVGEGGGATKTVAVTPGAWRFYCSLLGHEAMTRDLTVQ